MHHTIHIPNGKIYLLNSLAKHQQTNRLEQHLLQQLFTNNNEDVLIATIKGLENLEKQTSCSSSMTPPYNPVIRHGLLHVLKHRNWIGHHHGKALHQLMQSLTNLACRTDPHYDIRTALMTLLGSSHWPVRRAAIRCTERLLLQQDPQQIGRNKLLSLLSDSAPQVREAAIQGVTSPLLIDGSGRQTDFTVPHFLLSRLTQEDDRDVSHKLSASLTAVFPVLDAGGQQRMLDHLYCLVLPPATGQQKTAVSLTMAGRVLEQVTPHLTPAQAQQSKAIFLKIITDNHQPVILSAVLGLHRLADRYGTDNSIRQALVTCLTHSQESVRQQAIHSLETLKNQPATGSATLIQLEHLKRQLGHE